MRKLLWIAIPIIAIVGLIIWRVGLTKASNAALTTRMSGQKSAGVSVQAAVAGPALIQNLLQSPASVESPYQVKLAPQVTGMITFLDVREGDAVTKGEVIARLDPSAIEAQVIAAQANVAQAEQNLAKQQFGANPADVTITSAILQQQATVSTASANLNQLESNYAAQVQAARSAVSDADAKVRVAQAGVANARAALTEQQANLNDAGTKLTRTLSLYNQGFVAAQDVDDAKTAVEVQKGAVGVGQAQINSAQQAVKSAEAQLNSAQQQLSIVERQGSANIQAGKAAVVQAHAGLALATANRANKPAYEAGIRALQDALAAAKAQLQQAQAQRAYTIVKSPINGIVTSRSTDVGAIAAPGTPLVTIQFLDWLYVSSAFPIENIGTLRVGMPVQLTFDSFPGRTFTAPISNINQAADPQSRQFTVMIKLPNPGRAFKPGQFGKATAVAEHVSAAVAVPVEALKKTKAGDNIVFVVGVDSKVHATPITLGATDGKITEVKSGLSAGQEVVTISYQPIKDGTAVTVPGTAGASPGAGGSRSRGAGGRRSRSAAPQGN